MADRALKGVFWSLIFHGVLVLLLSKAPSQIDTNFAQKPVEITITDQFHGKNFVTETASKDDLLDQLKRKADYLAQFTKRVKEEVRAKLSGATKNREGQLPIESEEQRSRGQQGDSAQKSTSRPLALPGEGPKAGSSENGSTTFGRQVVVGASTAGEYIPGVKEGAFTALNTDRFTYYTFFARVNEQVRSRWVRNLRVISENLNAKAQEELASRERVTEVDIQLDKSGQFVRALVLRSSGSKVLDAAATDAFEDAAPFANPPQQMAEDDDLIHLRYGLLVQWSPTTLSVGR